MGKVGARVISPARFAFSKVVVAFFIRVLLRYSPGGYLSLGPSFPGALRAKWNHRQAGVRLVFFGHSCDTAILEFVGRGVVPKERNHARLRRGQLETVTFRYVLVENKVENKLLARGGRI